MRLQVEQLGADVEVGATNTQEGMGHGALDHRGAARAVDVHHHLDAAHVNLLPLVAGEDAQALDQVGQCRHVNAAGIVEEVLSLDLAQGLGGDLGADASGGVAGHAVNPEHRLIRHHRDQLAGEEAVISHPRPDVLLAAGAVVTHHRLHRDELGILAGDAANAPGAILAHAAHRLHRRGDLEGAHDAGKHIVDPRRAQGQVHGTQLHEGMAERQHLIPLAVGHGADGGQVHVTDDQGGTSSGTGHQRDRLVILHRAGASDRFGPQRLEEIAELLGADSVGYTSIQGLQSALGLSEQDLCMACLTAEYPTCVPGEKMRFQKTLI